MSKQKRYQKSGNKYAVYQVEQEYDPEIKNSRLIKKTYLGMAEEKGGPYKKTRKANIASVYEYGFINYLETIRLKKKIGNHLLPKLSGEEQAILKLLSYFLIATQYDTDFFLQWSNNQWFSKEKGLTEIDNRQLQNVFLKIGKKIESITDIEDLGITVKENITLLINSVIKRTPVVPGIGPEAFQSIHYDPKTIAGIFLFNPKSYNWQYVPKRPSDIKAVKELSNQFLTRLFLLNQNDELDIVDYLNENRRQNFILTSSSESTIQNLREKVKERTDVKESEQHDNFYLHTTDYSNTELKSISQQVNFISTIIEEVEKRILSFLEQIDYKEDEYPISIGILSSLHLILPLYEAIYKTKKNKLTSLEDIDPFITSEYLNLGKEKMVEYEDGETEIIQ